MCTSEVIPAIKKFQRAKEIEQEENIITFCGGIFTTSNEKCLLKTGVIDYVIPGIATKPLGDLLVKLYKETKDNESITKSFAEINETIRNIDVYGVANFENKEKFKSLWICSQLPTMQMSMWEEIIAQYQGYLNGKIGIYTARGCNKGCLFCSVQKETKQMVFRKDEFCVIHEINFLYKKGFTYFSIKDEDFSLDDERMFRILEGIQNEGIKIKIRARYDNASELIEKSKQGENLLEKLKRLGIHEIQYGIETFQKDIRAKVRKEYGQIDNKEAIITFIKSHAQVGIIANCSFILGLAGETVIYYQALKEFFDEISSNDNNPHLKMYLNFLTPHPYNSEFPLKNHTLIAKDLNLFTHKYPVCVESHTGIHTGIREIKRKMVEVYDAANQGNNKLFNPSLDKTKNATLLTKLYNETSAGSELDLMAIIDENDRNQSRRQ